jgi:hypothetical protein
MTAPRLVPVRGAPRLRVNPEAAPRAALLDGITGASDWRRRSADRAGLAAVRMMRSPASGSRSSAGPESAPLPWPHDIDALVTHWRDALPGFELIGVALPRQVGRPRLSALGWQCGTPVVLKAGRADDGIERETEVLTALAADPLPGISTPQVIAHNCATGSAQRSGDDQSPVWVATTAVHLTHQAPTLDARLDSFEADLTARLSHLPRPGSTAAHGEPAGGPAVPITRPIADTPTDTIADTIADTVIVHGDLTPWNLRRTPYALALFDWEACGWGPPGHDRRCYSAACAELRSSRWRRRGRTPGTPAHADTGRNGRRR